MRLSGQAGEKGPHQPFGQLLQRRSDSVVNLPQCLNNSGRLTARSFSFGEAPRRVPQLKVIAGDEVPLPAVRS
jgi:hypothetical protein